MTHALQRKLVWPRKETLALLAALMLPLLVGGIGWILMNLLDPGSDAMGLVFLLTFFLTIAPLIAAGPPYLILAIGFIFWAKNKSPQEILPSSWWLPFILSGLILPYQWRFALMAPRDEDPATTISEYFWNGIYCVPLVWLFGYFYVFLGRQLYRKLLSLPRHPSVPVIPHT